MPDKRQQSKQRRAARNRASRDALAARREAAATAAAATGPGASSSASSSTSTSSSSSGGPARPGLASLFGGGGRARGAGGAAPAPAAPPEPGLKGLLWGNRLGDKAVTIAVVFALISAIALLFYRVPADDRGEPLPAMFRGVAIAARERVTGQPVGDETVSLLDASGPAILFVIGLPVIVTLFALWGNRRPDRSRMLTFAMLAMAGTVLFTGQIAIFFFPALIALAVAGFRVRRADMPARVAERATRPSADERPSLASLFGFGGARTRSRGGAIDVDSEDTTPADADSRASSDAEADATLADLEAEIEAERASDRPTDTDTGDGTGGGTGTGANGGDRRGR